MLNYPGFRSDLREASIMLAGQNANIVFYRNPARFDPLPYEVTDGSVQRGFRRGVIPLDIPKDFSKALSDILGEKEVLFSLRNSSPGDIEDAFIKVFESGSFLEEFFNDYRVSVKFDFLKFLFVGPYGAYGTLRILTPHEGMENISWTLLRTTDDVDAIVYNANLGSIEGYRTLITDQRFDVIGFSPLVLEKDTDLMVYGAELSPSSLKIVGGPGVQRIPPDVFLGAFPVDIMVYCGGEEICRQLAEILQKSSGMADFASIPDIAIYDAGRIIVTPKRGLRARESPKSKSDDVPFEITDVYHRTNYVKRRNEIGVTSPHIIDHIGMRRLMITYSDHCKAHCNFCGVPKNEQKKRGLEDIISEMKDKLLTDEEYDSVHFFDNTFSTYRGDVVKLCQRIIEEGLERFPKACKFRADQVTGEMLDVFAKAGFTRVFYGIESFDDRVLEFMEKGITAKQNMAALEMTLKAGIRPGINLILPSAVDDDVSVLNTIRTTLDFVKRGATLNLMPYMAASFNTPITKKHPELIEYAEFYVGGMRGAYRRPSRVLLPDKMERLSAEGQKRLEERMDDIKSAAGVLVSINAYSLIYLAEVAGLLNEPGLKSEIDAVVDAEIQGATE
jgi:radical SAM superfamily enzyme YgiQ (UPF0313 family)